MDNAYDILNSPKHLKALEEYRQMGWRYLEKEAKRERFLNYILAPVYTGIRRYYVYKHMLNKE